MSGKFGKYEILEELGRGGFGTVYKAEDQVLGRLVAIKVLHPALVVELNFIERFRQEARTAAMLDHSNLVPVYDFGETEGRYYIAMGYMPGGSLKDLLKREGKLEPERACEILTQVGEGLEYAHARGIVHRDLKPGNILFDENGKARVADMGFAKVMSEGTSRSMSASGGLVGTPAYMAPETWRNKPATPQTDIYSLGCILYEMLTGEVLFEGESPAEVMTMHVIDGPQYSNELMQEMRAVLDKALQRDLRERYSNSKTMLSDFQSLFTTTRKRPYANSATKKVDPLILKGHTDAVLSVCWSPDGKRVASGSRDGTIILWYAETGERLRILNGQSQVVGCVTWSPDGKQLASSDSDGTITFWNGGKGEILRTLGEADNMMGSVTFSPDGRYLASKTRENNIIVWRADNGDRLYNLEDKKLGQLFKVTPNGEILFSDYFDFQRFFERLNNIDGFEYLLNIVLWSPDGKRLASKIVDRAITIWCVENRETLRTLETSTTGLVTSLSWSPDGKRLASGSWDNDIIIWYAETGERLRTLEGHAELVSSVSWSNDGKKLASGSWDNKIILWNPDTGERLHTLQGHTNKVLSVAWSPDGKTLASGGGDGTVRLWGIS